MARRALVTAVLFLVTGAVPPLLAQSPGVTYIYDELSRLVGVIDPNGEAAIYSYDAVGNLLSITRRSSTQVSIIEFTPNAGSIGASVTISGTGFSATPSENTVAFNGTSATITSATTTKIVTAVPTGTTSGPITVTSPNGSATSSASFTVTTAGPPTITSFTPSIGTSGTAVTITGTNYETTVANNRPKFNRSLALATASTATTITTSVPPSTSSGRIAVTTPMGEATSSADFFIPPSPYTAADVEYTGRMAFSEAKAVAIATANKIGLAVFDGTANQRVSLKVVPGPLATVSMYRPDGALLASRSVSSLTALIEPSALPITGTYTVNVDPAGSATGTTTLTAYDVPPDITGTMTPGGASQTVTIGTPGQNARLTFSGTLNQRVSLSISSGSPLGTVSILNPDGSTLGSASSGALAGFIDTKTLGSTGTYTVFVNPGEANTGSLTLTLYDVPADVTGTITPGGAPVTVTISTPGQNGRLTFGGTAGQRISLKISNGPIGTVSILNPDSSTLASTSSGSITKFIDTQTLGTTGTYTIVVDPSAANTGSLTLTLYDVPADVTGSVTIGGAGVNVTIGTPGQNGSLTFSGTSGQQVTVRITSNTMSTVTVKLLKPDASQLTSSTSSLGSFNLATQTLPDTGTYTIVVDPSQWNTGSMTVTVTSP